MTLVLHTIICSTRPGRVGPTVAEWFQAEAAAHGKFDAKLIDLADFALPLIDEPNHPRLKKYQQEHTKRWAASVAAADAFAFVTPEYNLGPTPALLNALNYLYLEWNYKPATFVSYGGVSGGLVAAQQARMTMLSLKVMPLVTAVPIPFVANALDADKNFVAQDIHKASAKAALDELHRWAEALRGLRDKL